MPDNHEVTRFLGEWAEGKPEALDDLTPLVYAELRQLAAGYLRNERRDHTLQPTALVHEAYIRLLRQQNPAWRDRSHFFGVAARLMREILVDHARRKQAGKRSRQSASLDGRTTGAPEPSREMVALDGALNALEKIDPRKSKAMELHYFGGLSADEIAGMLNVSAITIRRDLRMAESWIRREMQNG
ncbi:MAG: sigma-70 family RNA polymerase sigma factor [Acidobacteriota bacterium]|nr:sigma-70 family RNA polymerase sigma factor [Acidobacteriota bacterium]